MVELTRSAHTDALEDRAILDCIHGLVAEEHRLRDSGAPDTAMRLAEIGTNLDELWGLLRSRRLASAPGPLVQA